VGEGLIARDGGPMPWLRAQHSRRRLGLVSPDSLKEVGNNLVSACLYSSVYRSIYRAFSSLSNSFG
jgi:2-phosphoglycerate kinase